MQQRRQPGQQKQPGSGGSARAEHLPRCTARTACVPLRTKVSPISKWLIKQGQLNAILKNAISRDFLNMRLLTIFFEFCNRIFMTGSWLALWQKEPYYALIALDEQHVSAASYDPPSNF